MRCMLFFRARVPISAASGSTGIRASIRSSTPPWPGSRLLLSFMPARRLSWDSNRSPTTLAATIRTRMASSAASRGGLQRTGEGVGQRGAAEHDATARRAPARRCRRRSRLPRICRARSTAPACACRRPCRRSRRRCRRSTPAPSPTAGTAASAKQHDDGGEAADHGDAHRSGSAACCALPSGGRPVLSEGAKRSSQISHAEREPEPGAATVAG
jgi:hypothetical protein